MTTIALSTPIQAHGEQKTELTLRRPTSRECRQIGQLPYRIEKDESVGLNLDIAAKYIVVCAGIPSSSVDQLDVTDLNGLAWALAGFFMVSPQKTEAKAEASAD
ncbi:phage tail assembly protein [Pseudomonas oryziphila]|uniref:Phage tail assembly protein n=1 Tax=Pseudomonas entomophila TaxID=312306 RepID=A0A3Q8U1Y1_9PSED|nr:phage tail assembly protein [Pseudomonas oryziphila]AZL68784.1 phage tail assembly protein [Pseudomonas oryziphila]